MVREDHDIQTASPALEKHVVDGVAVELENGSMIFCNQDELGQTVGLLTLHPDGTVTLGLVWNVRNTLIGIPELLFSLSVIYLTSETGTRNSEIENRKSHNTLGKFSLQICAFLYVSHGKCQDIATARHLMLLRM